MQMNEGNFFSSLVLALFSAVATLPTVFVTCASCDILIAKKNRRGKNYIRLNECCKNETNYKTDEVIME